MLCMATMVGVLFLGLIQVAPVYAAPPAKGVVVEGHSVPKVALGSTRAHAIKVWGQPSYCQGAYNTLCTYNLSNMGGSADLNYTGAHGGNPTGGGKDVVATIDWIGIPGWRTTVGVTTANALANPESVVTAYPNGVVQRYGDGHLASVTDNHLGIEVQWIPQSYGQLYVMITIYPGK